MDLVGSRKLDGKLLNGANLTHFSQNGKTDEFIRLGLLPFQTLANVVEVDEEQHPVDQDQLHEIMVPTCSYRMGVREMALGLAVIDLGGPKWNATEALYANLWLPSRFALLFVYVAAISVSLVVFTLGRIKRCGREGWSPSDLWLSSRRRPRRRHSSSASSSPRSRSSSGSRRQRNSSTPYYTKIV